MRLKAAILFNFAKYVEWPEGAFAGPAAPLTFGILGRDPIGDELDAIVAGRTAHGRPVVVKRGPTLAGLEGCHVLYVSASERSRVGSIVAALNRRPVLTVGEFEDFLEQGGVIRMFLDESRLRFDVNLDAGGRAGLRLSSQMLRLARSIKGDRPKGE